LSLSGLETRIQVTNLFLRRKQIMTNLVINEDLVKAALDCLSNINCIVGMRCSIPDCFSTSGFYIEGHEWSDDGCLTSNEDWTDTSRCECFICHYEGEVRDFMEPDVTHAHIEMAANLLNWMEDELHIFIAEEETRPVDERMPAAIYRAAYLLALAEQKGRLEGYCPCPAH
jgi:hypothetical protein